MGYRGGAEAKFERVCGDIQLEQPVCGRLPAGALAADVPPDGKRHGDRREVVDLEHTPGLLADANRFIAPAEIAGLVSRVQPQVSTPGGVVAVGVVLGAVKARVQSRICR
jgi:hypothetical protein